MCPAIVVVVLALLAGCRSVDDPPLRKGPPLSLALNVPSDSAFWVDVTRRSVGRHDFMGEEFRIEAFSRFVYDLHAVQRSRTGDTQFHLTPRSYDVDDWVVLADGARSRPPEIEQLFEDLEAAILLHPVTFTVTAEGRLAGLNGLADLENAVAAVVSRRDLVFQAFPVPLRHAWRRVFMAHIDDRPIRRHLLESYGALPAGNVRLGDEWRLPAEKPPWPHLPVEEHIRLIDQRGDQFYLVTRAQDDAAPGPGTTRYKGGTHGTMLVDALTGMPSASDRSTYWKRRRGRAAWEQFTMKTFEASESAHIKAGSVASSPPLNAINRFPFLENAQSEPQP